MDIYLEQEVKNVRKVNEDKQYWFIRTYGGLLFDYFTDQNYVGLGLNNVPLAHIRNGKKDFGTLQEFIAHNTEYEKGAATRWANQLISFVTEVKLGDTVVIPDVNSNRFAIGTVVGDIKVVGKPGQFADKGVYRDLPQKRREIRWDKIVWKDELQSDFKSITFSQQGIVKVNKYREIIEGNVTSVFKMENKTYLVIKINQDEDINAFALSNFLNQLTYFYEEYCKEAGVQHNEELSIKIQLQSKGKMALKGAVAVGVVGLGLLILSSNNPSLKMQMKEDGTIELEGKSDGFLKSVSDFLDRNQERQQRYILFQDSIQKLKAEQKDTSDLKHDIPQDGKGEGKKND